MVGGPNVTDLAGVDARGPVVELNDVAHSYGPTRALDGVTIVLHPGVTALVGVNGAGKTTLMSVVAGALRPSSGKVRVAGLDPYGRTRRGALRAVALMPQAMSLPGNMTAQEVVEYLAWMRGLTVRRARQRSEESLDQVGLGSQAQTRVGRLSGGMLRRVALAQALASDSELLLLDEPSTGLDPAQRRTMVDLLCGLERTVLMSSHVMEDVVDVAQRVIVLHDGLVRFDGAVTELQSLAPAGTEAAKMAEVGFLTLIASHPSDRS